MHPPQDGTQGHDPGSEDRPLQGAWGCLQVGLSLLGASFLPLGLASLFAALAIPGAGLGPWWCLLLPAWALTPLLCSLLLVQAAHRLDNPGAEASTALVVAAAAVFVGLAWLAMTVAILTGGGLRS
jgi:hypothetical protein